MSNQDCYPPDQQFGAQAARDQQRVDESEDSNVQERVAAQVTAKEPRVGNKAEPQDR